MKYAYMVMSDWPWNPHFELYKPVWLIFQYLCSCSMKYHQRSNNFAHSVTRDKHGLNVNITICNILNATVNTKLKFDQFPFALPFLGKFELKQKFRRKDQMLDEMFSCIIWGQLFKANPNYCKTSTTSSFWKISYVLN